MFSKVDYTFIRVLQTILMGRLEDVVSREETELIVEETIRQVLVAT